MLVFVSILTAVLMEGVAWFAHKYLMHGPLWFLHKDHHVKKPGYFERNDWFFLIFSIPSILCMAYGLRWELDWLLGLGIGQAIYGFFYILVHDIFVHNRLRFDIDNPKNLYLKGMLRAHKLHHRCLNKYGADNFGFLWVPQTVRRQLRGEVVSAN